MTYDPKRSANDSLEGITLEIKEWRITNGKLVFQDATSVESYFIRVHEKNQ